MCSCWPPKAFRVAGYAPHVAGFFLSNRDSVFADFGKVTPRENAYASRVTRCALRVARCA